MMLAELRAGMMAWKSVVLMAASKVGSKADKKVLLLVE
jgi:hypothetical protein